MQFEAKALYGVAVVDECRFGPFFGKQAEHDKRICHALQLARRREEGTRIGLDAGDELPSERPEMLFRVSVHGLKSAVSPAD
jgi:hypothetical protein